MSTCGYLAGLMLLLVPGTAMGQAPIRMTHDSLGALALDRNQSVSVSILESRFQGHRVLYHSTESDGPTLHIFTVASEEGLPLFEVWGVGPEGSPSAPTDDSPRFRLHRVVVRSPEISDPFGIRVGQRYSDVVAARGVGLEFGATHHDLYLGGESFYYGIPLPVPAPNEPDRNPTGVSRSEVEAGDWAIAFISWPTWVW